MEHWGTAETLPLITGKHGCLSVLSWSWVISRSVPSDAASVSGWGFDLRKEAEMRIIGLDLAITSAHKAVVMSDPLLPDCRGNSPMSNVPSPITLTFPRSIIAEIAADPKPTASGVN